MIRHMSLCLFFAATLAMAGANAQGHRPAGVGGQSAGHSPTAFGGSLESQRFHSDFGRTTADTKRAEADAKREAAKAKNKSEDARAAHPPNEHAADEAFLAEQNADNKDQRDQRRDSKSENRADHGKK